MTRQNAVNVLNAAAAAVGSIRGQQHGSLNESFDMIAAMWSVYINHSQFKATGVMPVPLIKLNGADVLRMMAQLKQARAVWGYPNNQDHYVDEVGYSALTAAYLGVPVADPHAVPEHSVDVTVHNPGFSVDDLNREAPEPDYEAPEPDYETPPDPQPMAEVQEEDLLAAIRAVNAERDDVAIPAFLSEKK